MNDSTLQTSPDWPTRWPKGSFSPAWTVLFLLLLAGVVLLAFFVVAVGIVVWAVASGHSAQALNAVRNPYTNATGLTVNLVAQLAFEGLVVLTILLGVPHLARFSLRDLGFRPIGSRSIAYTLAGIVAMVAVADVASSLIATYTHAVHPQLVERMFEHYRTQPEMMLFLGTYAVVLAPFLEETIFRLFIFNIGLRYGGFWMGAIPSGALFGLAHTVGGASDPVSGALLGLSGIVLCWVYYRSRNIYASMMTHGIFNGLSVAVLYFAPKLAGG